MQFNPGERVKHNEFGQGVIISLAESYARVFFLSGEQQIPVSSLALYWATMRRLSPMPRAIMGEQDTHGSVGKLMPSLLDSASSLTSAKLTSSHQVVLTHRVTMAAPRRFMIADEVGLGKTIETALILRELASRGELNRALMIVPRDWSIIGIGIECFQLNFEVFGREGDVSDRRSNAFAKHNLIASVDTLKRKTRVKKLLEAPMWDRCVYEELDRLQVRWQTKKTENYKLAEALRDHTKDLILLCDAAPR